MNVFKKKFVAIIPARGGSKRLPRKNVLDFGGVPMFVHGLRAAQASGVFDDIIVSSDDKEILALAKEYGAIAIPRPDEMATDTAHELTACLHALDEYGSEVSFFCVIYPTAVFLEGNDFKGAKALLDKNSDVDGLMCVSPFNYHPYKALKSSGDGCVEMLFPKEGRERSQTYPHMFASNGTFYVMRADSVRQNPEKGYYQARILPYEIPAERAIDIDTPEDLVQAKAIAAFKRKG